MLDRIVWRRAHRAFFALTPTLGFALAIILLVSMLEPTSLSALQALSAEGGAPVGPTILEVEPAKNAVYAVVMAKSKGVRIEVLSERTEVSTTWANPDGTFTTESFGSPIRIKDENGTDGWRILDFDLEFKPDGTVGPTSGYLPVTLSGEASAEEVATTGLVSIAADAKSNVEFGWNGALPEPVLDGATATYEDVLPNVDLVVELTSSGFEQFFVLKTRPNADEKLELRLPLQADGLDVQELDNGSVQFTNDDDELIGTVAPPLVWDSSEEGKSGLPINTTGLEMALATGGRGPPELVITPAASFLSDPDVVYPVIIDPSYSGAPTVDTYVRSDYPTTTYATYDPTELQVGTYNSGTTKARSYLNFSASSWKGADVTAATLKLYLFHSYNCTASKMYVYPAGLASNSTNWNNKPSMNTSYSGSITTSKGYSACAAGYANINVLNVADYLASTNASTVGMGLKALSETDNTSWKRFNSANASSNKPSLSVTYNRYPSTATTPTLAPSVVVGSDTFATSASPVFSSSTTEPDGSTTKVTFEVHNAAAMSASTLVSSCTTPLVASGATASCSVPTALTDGVTYWVRALGNDGTLAAKAWSAAHKFTVITSAPQTPAISCPSPYTDGSWNASLPTVAVSCTVTVASSTAGGAATSLSITKDSGTPSVFPLTRGAGTTESVSVSVSKGSHTIQAVTTSSAGARGVSTYTFGYGTATLSSPTAGFKTTDTVRVTAEAPPAGTADVDVSVHWRVAGTTGSAWNESDQAIIFTSTAEGVKVPGSLWHTQSAVVDETGGSPVELSSRTPVVLELQVCVTYTPGGMQCTADEDAPLTVLRVPHAFGAGFPTAEAGPGQVALWTGEFNLSETDVTVPTPEGGLSISRAHSTFAGPITDISKPNRAFGPGWIASFDGSGSGAASFEIVDNTTLDGTFALIDEEGVPLVYRQPGEGRLSAPEGVYEPVDDDTAFLEAVLEVAGTGTSSVLTLTELDGTVTTWHTGSTTDPLEWVPVSVAEPGGLGTTSYTVNAQNQITRILAPQPAGVTSCTTMVAGCRALKIEYAVTSTATSGTPGNIAGQVTHISFIAYDPDKTSGGSLAPGMNTVVVARYTYYSNGRLATVTDPRSGLGTSYQYQVDGSDVTHLTRLVNAGLAGFDFSYETDTVAGVRLKSVSRDGATSSAPSSVLSSYVYGIDPTTATTGLPALTADDVTAWQQAAAPTYGAAEFGPDHPVSTTNPANLTANDWKYASLQYTDAEGYTVNTGEHGAGAWQLSATDYDDTGNVIRTFDNRAIAAITAIYTGTPIAVDQYASLTQFNPAFTIYDAATASTVNVPAGMFVTDAWSPARDAVVNGTLQSARVHTHYEYDEGAPHSGIDTSVAGAPRRWGLVTTATTGAASPTSGSTTAGVSAPADLEVISVSQSGYDPIDSGVDDSDASGWRLGSATVQTTVMSGSGKDITTKSRYDTTGGLLEYRAPLSVGSDEASVLSTDYTAGTITVKAECGNKPEWAGMPCWSGTAAAPVGDDLPDTMTTKYTMWLASAETTETSGSTASEVVRTTTTNYLADGRTESGHTVITGTSTDQPELLSRTVYDSATGMSTGTQQVNASNVVVAESTASYDLWGREISSTNSLGDVATTVYVAPGQPGAGQTASYTDAKGTVTYTYDGTDALGHSEQRGLVTAMTVSGVGTYTAAYDDQASMLLQTAPGGLSQTFTYDQVGQLLTQSHVGPTPATGESWVLEWSREYNLSGQVVSERAPSIDLGGVTGTDPTHKYSYDRAGRLIQTLDRSGDNGCVVRLYEFDKQGNRTSLSTTNPDATGACNSGTTATKAWTYDLSSRVLTAGDGVGQYEYDLLGRVTSMPEADAPVSDAAGDNPVTLGYYASDDIYSIAQGGVEASFTIDPLGRRLVETTTTGSMVTNTLTRHYTDSSDNPSWIVQNTETTRYTPALGSGLGAVVYPDAHIELTLDDPHGDIITTVVLPTTGVVSGITGWSMFDEYGNALTGLADTGAAAYGWVGSRERATLDNGLILMGARVYNSVTGRFLSPDPVAGGNENSYNYPNDPVNRFDTTGLFDWMLALDIGLLVLSFVPGLGVAAIAAKVVILAVRVISAVSKVQKVAKVVRTIGNAVKRTSNALKVKSPKKTANSCRANSFVPGTGVLMADHSTKPIEDVALGDFVLATDPLTGETVAQEVTDLIIGRGSKDLVTISIDTNLDGVVEEVVATDGHPFWTDLRGWVDAGDLVVGDQLRGDSGELIAVTGVATESRIAIVYNLTVLNFHTFYVLIDDQEVLTHNCKPSELRTLSDKELKRNGIDAHEVKREVYGQKAAISRYDLFVKKGSSAGRRAIYSAEKKTGRGAVRTGWYLGR